MNEKILIAGAGVSGKAAANLLHFLNIPFDVIDEKPVPGMTETAWDGNPIQKHYSLAILSPGIKPGSPLLCAVKNAADRVIGEFAFAAKYVSCPVIAITGTNGKTTTTEITTALFQSLGERAEAAGNIGSGMSDAAVACMEGKTDRLIAEVSSFQMEYADGLETQAAAFLNIASDHLDRHGSPEEYERLKWSLAKTAKKAVVLNASLKNRFRQNFSVPVITFSARENDADFTLKNGMDICYKGTPILNVSEIRLKGLHNIENIMAALALTAAVRGESVLKDQRLLDAVKNFAPDYHRMEIFLEQNGIVYIDDSKATNPHAVNAALDSAGDKGIRLLLGGLDKDMDFAELKPHLRNVRMAYLTGQCREKIFDVLRETCPVTLCADFDETVRQMCGDALPGEIVMLSPATASMDRFRNYRERGEHFKELCLRYAKK